MISTQAGSPSLKYDKGEKRFKHVGRGPNPEIRFFEHHPRRWVGLCPRDISEDLRIKLLNEAIPEPAGDRDIDYVKSLLVVHNGAIYQAKTSDAGITYHGFPYRGRLAGDMVEKLRSMAQTKNCVGDFEKWVKTHINV